MHHDRFDQELATPIPATQASKHRNSVVLTLFSNFLKIDACTA